jgi:hypothetical protein
MARLAAWCATTLFLLAMLSLAGLAPARAAAPARPGSRAPQVTLTVTPTRDTLIRAIRGAVLYNACSRWTTRTPPGKGWWTIVA